MHKFRSKEDLAAAIIAQRGEIESSIKAGESNSLMQATGMTDHASFAKYKEACSAGRLDTPSKHDFVGFTCVAHSQAELDDHVLATVCNELSPDENLTVTAADLSEAYMKHNPDDKELHSCPMLVPPGQNADEVLADIDKDLQLQSGASHAQVLEAMSKATDDMEKTSQEIGDLIQQTEDAKDTEEAKQPEPVAASEAKLAEATNEIAETGSDSDGYIQVAEPEPVVQSMAQLAQHDLDNMVDMAVAEHEEQMEASEASKARTEHKVVQEPQEVQEAQQSQKPIKSASMSQAQLDEQLDRVTQKVEAMGNPTLTMKTIQSKADKSATQPSKPSKAELKAAKKSAAKAAKKSNAQLQKQLDQAEHALHPVVRSASKAFGQGKMSLDQVAAKFSKAGLHGATPCNTSSRNGPNHISPELQQQLDDLVHSEEEMQTPLFSGSQVKSIMDELKEHREDYKEIIQQHQDFSQAMHSKATESNLRLQSTVEAVRSFFSNALVNSGHAPLPAIEAGGMQALDRADESGIPLFREVGDGQYVKVNKNGEMMDANNKKTTELNKAKELSPQEIETGRFREFNQEKANARKKAKAKKPDEKNEQTKSKNRAKKFEETKKIPKEDIQFVRTVRLNGGVDKLEEEKNKRRYNGLMNSIRTIATAKADKNHNGTVTGTDKEVDLAYLKDILDGYFDTFDFYGRIQNIAAGNNADMNARYLYKFLMGSKKDDHKFGPKDNKKQFTPEIIKKYIIDLNNELGDNPERTVSDFEAGCLHEMQKYKNGFISDVRAKTFIINMVLGTYEKTPTPAAPEETQSTPEV